MTMLTAFAVQWLFWSFLIYFAPHVKGQQIDCSAWPEITDNRICVWFGALRVANLTVTAGQVTRTNTAPGPLDPIPNINTYGVDSTGSKLLYLHLSFFHIPKLTSSRSLGLSSSAFPSPTSSAFPLASSISSLYISGYTNQASDVLAFTVSLILQSYSQLSLLHVFDGEILMQTLPTRYSFSIPSVMFSRVHFVSDTADFSVLDSMVSFTSLSTLSIRNCTAVTTNQNPSGFVHLGNSTQLPALEALLVECSSNDAPNSWMLNLNSVRDIGANLRTLEIYNCRGGRRSGAGAWSLNGLSKLFEVRFEHNVFDFLIDPPRTSFAFEGPVLPQALPELQHFMMISHRWISLHSGSFFPSNWPPGLQSLVVIDSQITGRISLHPMKALRRFDVRNNRLEGPVPGWLLQRAVTVGLESFKLYLIDHVQEQETNSFCVYDPAWNRSLVFPALDRFCNGSSEVSEKLDSAQRAGVNMLCTEQPSSTANVVRATCRLGARTREFLTNPVWYWLLALPVDSDPLRWLPWFPGYSSFAPVAVQGTSRFGISWTVPTYDFEGTTSSRGSDELDYTMELYMFDFACQSQPGNSPQLIQGKDEAAFWRVLANLPLYSLTISCGSFAGDALRTHLFPALHTPPGAGLSSLNLLSFGNSNQTGELPMELFDASARSVIGYVHLPGNRFTRWPTLSPAATAALSQLQLINLGLSGNQFSSIPAYVFVAGQLESVDLNDNDMRNVPISRSWLPKGGPAAVTNKSWLQLELRNSSFCLISNRYDSSLADNMHWSLVASDRALWRRGYEGCDNLFIIFDSSKTVAAIGEPLSDKFRGSSRACWSELSFCPISDANSQAAVNRLFAYASNNVNTGTTAAFECGRLNSGCSTAQVNDTGPVVVVDLSPPSPHSTITSATPIASSSLSSARLLDDVLSRQHHLQQLNLTNWQMVGPLSQLYVAQYIHRLSLLDLSGNDFSGLLDTGLLAHDGVAVSRAQAGLFRMRVSPGNERLCYTSDFLQLTTYACLAPAGNCQDLLPCSLDPADEGVMAALRKDGWFDNKYVCGSDDRCVLMQNSNSSTSSIFGLILSQSFVNSSRSLPSYLRNLTRLSSFSAVRQNLQGTIPQWLGELRQLRHISLSANSLTGPLPDLGALAQLTVLELDQNPDLCASPDPQFSLPFACATTTPETQCVFPACSPTNLPCPLERQATTCTNFRANVTDPVTQTTRLEHYPTGYCCMNSGCRGVPPPCMKCADYTCNSEYSVNHGSSLGVICPRAACREQDCCQVLQVQSALQPCPVQCSKLRGSCDYARKLCVCSEGFEGFDCTTPTVSVWFSILPVAFIVVCLLAVSLGYCCVGKGRRSLRMREAAVSKDSTDDQIPSFFLTLRLVYPALLTVLDVSSDVLFAVYLYNLSVETSNARATLWKVLSFVSFGSLGLPFCLNFLALVHEFRKSDKAEFWKWYQKNSVTTGLIFAASAFGTNISTLLSSHILGLRAFSAPLNWHQRASITGLGLISILCEDLPQLVVQIIFVSTIESLNIVTTISITTTVFCLVIGLSNRVLKCLSTSSAATKERFEQQLSSSQEQTHGRQHSMVVSDAGLRGSARSNQSSLSGSPGMMEMSSVPQQEEHSKLARLLVYLQEQNFALPAEFR